MSQLSLVQEAAPQAPATTVLSVVIASARSARDLAMSLNALSGQTGEGIEIIVADGSGDQALKALMAKYPRVKFMPLPAGTGLPDLLGAGISRTTGDIIALTDTTCVVGLGNSGRAPVGASGDRWGC